MVNKDYMTSTSTVQLEGLNPSPPDLNSAIGNEEALVVSTAAQAALNGRVEQDLSSISNPQEIQVASSLPPQLWCDIFCLLNAEELAKIAPVCRQWITLASSDEVSYGNEEALVVSTAAQAALNGRVEQDLSSISNPQEIQVASSLPPQLWCDIFCLLNAEELAKIAPVCRQWITLASSDEVSYEIPFPSWLKDIDAGIWSKLDLKKYGLDLSKVPRVNRRALTKALKPLSRKVENNMGITNMVIPKGLTLNKVLEIANDNSVPIRFILDKILTNFGDIAVEANSGIIFYKQYFCEH